MNDRINKGLYNVNGGKVTAKDTNLMSIYSYAPTIGMRPQQLYGMRLNGSLPNELLVDVLSPDGQKMQPMVKVQEANEYFASKNKERIDKMTTKVAENPGLVADAFISMLEKDNPKLGKQVRTWWEKKSAAPEESK